VSLVKFISYLTLPYAVLYLIFLTNQSSANCFDIANKSRVTSLVLLRLTDSGDVVNLIKTYLSNLHLQLNSYR
jgi:hypothetical protein